MTSGFTGLDWAVVGLYLLAVTGVGLAIGRQDSRDARDYFLASGHVPAWLAAISVLATTQSAATFLGGPDFGYRGDFTYLSTFIGAFLAVIIVARVFIPRFYAHNVTTVYELLGERFGAGAMRAAGGMFLIGRIISGGARLYLAAIAVSMIIFRDVTALDVSIASAVLTLGAFVFAFHKGLRVIVWLDLLQFVVYVGAAIGIALLLLHRLHLPLDTIVRDLSSTPSGQNKLRLLDFSVSLSDPFSLPAVLTGIVLLYIGNYALDQDTTQRLLACRDARSSARGLYMSIAATVPIVWLFIVIGALLYLFYLDPGSQAVRASAGPAAKFHGEDITVLMHFILTEVPAGARGLMTVGVIATAIGTTMSALNAMSSVLIQDFYRPWRSMRSHVGEHHYVTAGRVGMAAMSVATFAMAVVSYYWQHFTRAPLLDFVLSVMNFAYAGLLGVYFTAVFTTRGSSRSVIAALLGGFGVVLVLQPSIAHALALPKSLQVLSFPWQLCIGTLVAFAVCMTGNNPQSVAKESPGTEFQEI